MTAILDPTSLLGAPAWRRRHGSVEVAAYGAAPDRSFHTLVTCGRDGGAADERELILCLPAEWTLELDPGEPRWGWPLRLLIELRAAATAIGAVVPDDDEEPRPFDAGITLAASMVVEALAPARLALAPGDRYAQVLPLTASERGFASMMGGEQLLAAAIARGVDLTLVDPMRTPLVSADEFPDSSASRPGMIPIDETLLREMQPELYRGKQITGRPARVVGASPSAEWISRLRRHLACGDLQPAQVVRLEPLVVAVRTDELDCVALIGFPGAAGESLRRRLKLERGSRLSAVNTYFGEDGPKQNDVTRGPEAGQSWHAFWPIVSESVCSDAVALARARRRLDEDDFSKLASQAAEYVAKKGWVVRNGAPLLGVVGGAPIEQLDAPPPASAPAAAPARRAAKARRASSSDDGRPSLAVPGWAIWIVVVVLIGVVRACAHSSGHH